MKPNEPRVLFMGKFWIIDFNFLNCMGLWRKYLLINIGRLYFCRNSSISWDFSNLLDKVVLDLYFLSFLMSAWSVIICSFSFSIFMIWSFFFSLSLHRIFLFLFVKLRYNGHRLLCKFRVYSVLIWYLYIAIWLSL